MEETLIIACISIIACITLATIAALLLSLIKKKEALELIINDDLTGIKDFRVIAKSHPITKINEWPEVTITTSERKPPFYEGSGTNGYMEDDTDVYIRSIVYHNNEKVSFMQHIIYAKMSTEKLRKALMSEAMLTMSFEINNLLKIK